MILGFDTSYAYCGTALLSEGECVAAIYEDMSKGQAERLFPMIEETLREAGAGWGDLTLIGVGVGPGNFTGVRISVSAARGLSLGLGVPAIGVSLLDALALGADGPILACLDARRGQGYFQRFGRGDPEPFVAAIDEVDPNGAPVIGNCAAQIAARTGVPHRPAAYAPASAIARIAAMRPPGPRPAPIYLRAPDAAPPRHAPPAIVP